MLLSQQIKGDTNHCTVLASDQFPPSPVEHYSVPSSGKERLWICKKVTGAAITPTPMTHCGHSDTCDGCNSAAESENQTLSVSVTLPCRIRKIKHQFSERDRDESGSSQELEEETEPEVA